MCAAASVSWITRITGTTPPTAASKRSCTLAARAASYSSSPCCESTCLLAVTTWRPASIARRMYSRAGSSPPITSTTRSERSTMSSKSPRLRVSTPLISGRRPVLASIESARSSSSEWNAAPTVPWPRRPTLNVTGGQILVGLAADDHARIPVQAEDHRRARDRVVVARHRVAIGAGGRHDEHVPGTRMVEQRVGHEDVAGLAVHAHDAALGLAAEAVRDIRVVSGGVEHRPRVVGHTAVNRNIRAHAGHLLDRAHRVKSHAGVPDERATRLAEHGHALGRTRQQGLHVLVDVRRLLVARVRDRQSAAEIQKRIVAQPGEHLGDLLERVEVEDLRADVRVQAAHLERLDPVERARQVVDLEAELGVDLAGLDLLVGVGLDSWGDAQQDPLAGSNALEAVELVERVGHDVPHALLDGVAQLCLGLVVAVEVDALGRNPATQREEQLPARGDVGGDSLLGQQPESRGAREGLAGVDHLEVVGARAEGV